MKKITKAVIALASITLLSACTIDININNSEEMEERLNKLEQTIETQSKISPDDPLGIKDKLNSK